MAYLDQASTTDRVTSAAGVIAVHAALGYALIVGLQYTGVIEHKETVSTFWVEPEDNDSPPPPPPPPADPVPTPQAQTPAPPVYMPPTPFNLPLDPPTSDPVPLPTPGPIVPNATPSATPSPAGTMAPLGDPVAARPRNEPGGWITTSDYRSSWINRGMTGIAGFRVTVGTNGRAQGCVITQSTGHGALDEATCQLIERRARFEPARDAQGNRTSGTFASKVRWQIPE